MIVRLYPSTCPLHSKRNFAVAISLVPNDAHSAAKSFEVNCSSLSVLVKSSIAYGIIQPSCTTLVTCDVIVLLTGGALVSCVYRSVMTTMSRFSAPVRVSGPRILIVTNFSTSDGESSLNSCLCLLQGDVFHSIRTATHKHARPAACAANIIAARGYRISSLPRGVLQTLGNARCTEKLLVAALAQIS